MLTTELDHDGGVAPWVELAADKELTVRVAGITDELTVDYDDLERQLGDRTRVVAFALASNATGSLADAKRICALAREAGAISWIDAVHFAAHEPIDVRELGCDVLLCSPYKFCGPHLGIAYVRRELAETWRPYKARPSASTPVGRKFETGTLPYELLAGFSATIAYLDSIGGIGAIRDYERELGAHLIENLPDNVTLYGPPTMDGRVPTFLFNVDGVPAVDAAHRLAERGIRCLVRRQLVLRLARPASAGAVAARGRSRTTTPSARSTGCSKRSLRSERREPGSGFAGNQVRLCAEPGSRRRRNQVHV